MIEIRANDPVALDSSEFGRSSLISTAEAVDRSSDCLAASIAQTHTVSSNAAQVYKPLQTLMAALTTVASVLS